MWAVEVAVCDRLEGHLAEASDAGSCYLLYSAVRRVMRVFPLKWPEDPATTAQMEEAAAREDAVVGPVLVFWQPTRQTFVTTTVLPLDAEGDDVRNFEEERVGDCVG
jgi:hypothetical protein